MAKHAPASPVSRAEAIVARAEAAAELLAARTRESHEAAAALRDATREAKAVLERMVPAEVSALIDKTVVAGLETMGDQIETAQRESVDHVFKVFDDLCATLMGEEDDGKPTLAETVTAFRDRLTILGMQPEPPPRAVHGLPPL